MSSALHVSFSSFHSVFLNPVSFSPPWLSLCFYILAEIFIFIFVSTKPFSTASFQPTLSWAMAGMSAKALTFHASTVVSLKVGILERKTIACKEKSVLAEVMVSHGRKTSVLAQGHTLGRCQVFNTPWQQTLWYWLSGRDKFLDCPDFFCFLRNSVGSVM